MDTPKVFVHSGSRRQAEGLAVQSVRAVEHQCADSGRGYAVAPSPTVIVVGIVDVDHRQRRVCSDVVVGRVAKVEVVPDPGVEAVDGPLPRNPNGKIDRKRLSTEWIQRQETAS